MANIKSEKFFILPGRIEVKLERCKVQRVQLQKLAREAGLLYTEKLSFLAFYYYQLCCMNVVFFINYLCILYQFIYLFYKNYY